MSVIFGIIDSGKIIIAGDKRISTKTGKFISDTDTKVFRINKSLAFATAGNVAIGKAILADLEKIKVENMKVEDIVEVTARFYRRIEENNCSSIFQLPFYGLIAGLGKDGKSHLVNIGKFSNGFMEKEVQMALYPPADVNQTICNILFANNFSKFRDEFCEKTIREIAEISKLVSATGAKWEYTISTKTGVLYDF